MNKSRTARKRFFILLALGMMFVGFVLISCAGGPTAKEQVREASQNRSYERFKSDHELLHNTDLDEVGIYYAQPNFYVVISLSDSGTDRYPEWAANKFMNSLYSYRAVDQREVSDQEFFELVLHFKIDKIIQDKYENIARVTIKERAVERFLDSYDSED